MTNDASLREALAAAQALADAANENMSSGAGKLDKDQIGLPASNTFQVTRFQHALWIRCTPFY